MKKNILFNGCSWTYGAELIHLNEVFWERWRYSTHVANHFSCNHLNIAENSCSNDQIVRTTIEELEKNYYDLVVLQWTFHERTEINDTLNYSKFIKLTPNKIRSINCEKSRQYYTKIYGPIMGTINYQKNKYIMSQYLKSKNINYFYINLHKYKEYNNPFMHLPQDSDILVLKDIINRRDGDYCQRNKRGKAGDHPSPKGHKKIADKLIHYIEENNLL
jgi:hypothetical protein